MTVTGAGSPSFCPFPIDILFSLPANSCRWMIRCWIIFSEIMKMIRALEYRETSLPCSAQAGIVLIAPPQNRGKVIINLRNRRKVIAYRASTKSWKGYHTSTKSWKGYHTSKKLSKGYRTSSKSWKGYIFTAVNCDCVCVFVCLCVSVCLSLNKISAKRMHRFGCGFRQMVALHPGSDPIEIGDLWLKV